MYIGKWINTSIKWFSLDNTLSLHLDFIHRMNIGFAWTRVPTCATCTDRQPRNPLTFETLSSHYYCDIEWFMSKQRGRAFTGWTPQKVRPGSRGVYSAAVERLALLRIFIPCKSCILTRTISVRAEERSGEERREADFTPTSKAEWWMTGFHSLQMEDGNEDRARHTNQCSKNTFLFDAVSSSKS